MHKIDYGIAMKALLGDISECGDIGVVKVYEKQCFLALVDVLGHGAEARIVAILAEEYFNENYNKDLTCIIKGLHEHLIGSRGAVVALCHFDICSGSLSFVGVGNITVRIFGARPTRFVSRDGIVGYGKIRPQMQVLKLLPGDVLLLHSDGIKEHFDAIECAGLFRETAQDIVSGIMNRFGNKNDDSSCIALKYLK